MVTMNVRNTMRDYLRILFRRWKVFVIGFAVMVATVLTGLQLKTPVFESKVTMLILAKKQVNSLYYKEAAEYPFTVMTVTQSEIVKSNPVMERVVRSLKLDEQGDDYEKRFASRLKSIIIDARLKALAAKLKRLSETAAQEHRFRRAVESLKKKVRVEPVRESDLFVILVRDYDATTAAQIANTVSRSYCIFDLEQQLAELKQKYGDKHLYVIQLKDNISRMEEGLSGRALSNIEAIGPASVKIIEQATPAVEPVGKSRKVMALVGVILGLFLGGILAFLADSLDSTIKDPQDITRVLRIPYLGYVPKQVRLSGKVPLIVAGCLRLVCVVAGIWLFVRFVLSLMIWFSASKITEGVQVNNDISWDLLIGSVTLFIVNAVAAKGAGILSRIWNAATFKKIQPARLQTVLHPYQTVAQKLYLAMKNNGQKSIAFIAVSEHEGVSTLVSSVAMFLATQMNLKVLAIDANLRSPSLHKIFKIENTSGLTDVLIDNANLAKSVVAVMDNLDVMPARTTHDEPVSMLDSPSFIDMVKKAEKTYDMIIIDTPNLRMYHDAFVLSSMVDTVVLNIAEGQTKHEALAASLAPLKDKKAPLMGAILNKRSFAIPGFLYDRT